MALSSYPSMNLRTITTALLRNIKTILALSGVFGLLAIGYLIVVPAHYDASADVLLDPRRLQVVQNDLTPRAEQNDSAVSLVESAARVMQSERVLRGVIDRLGLDHDREFVGGGLLDKIRGLFSSEPSEDAKMTALRALQRKITVQRASRTYVVQITARSDDPIKAARIADAIATVYTEDEVAARAEMAKRVGAAMTGRLQELADRLRDAERHVQEFKEQHDLVEAGKRLLDEQKLEELNTQLTAARTRTTEQRARLEQIERALASGAGPDAIAEALQSPTITALRTQYAQVIRNEGTAAAVLGSRHPDVKIIHEQIANYRRLITEELRRISAAARNDYLRARATEDQLNANFNQLKQKVVRDNETMVRLRELERVSESSRAVYEAFLVRAKEVGEQGSVDTSNVRIVGVAVPPNRPTGPRVSLVLMAALVGGVLGCSIVVLREQRRSA